ncbi:hypothetical protein [Peptacetobacter hiranonis]|uniref:Polymerase beta nucleotidyltransferase domain-containing protein n=1 Tax=Peptacetobacter hiranonis (strain DSM 13275 / JCM 10541 / KCTC 15199 / TO-931) TaxID=500633 RepID=B6FWH5_PEPHT|nr:hypothetical protein [Peptacetobacter hiranonis]EEA86082.1 hypothetical protein CLOHIR_00224 [Peptacetobacter hiranonis DSM 13275]QEK21228.1 hypothetical protein KGNDJEFE_01715 [Peptacetobacter hiranonis]
MGKKEEKAFNFVIDKLKNDENNISIMLVGSAKCKNLADENLSINDIDLFIIRRNQISDQIREFSSYFGVDFDINYFSIESANRYIERGEKFFVKAISNPVVVFEREEVSESIIEKCKIMYDKINKNNKKEVF